MKSECRRAAQEKFEVNAGHRRIDSCLGNWIFSGLLIPSGFTRALSSTAGSWSDRSEQSDSWVRALNPHLTRRGKIRVNLEWSVRKGRFPSTKGSVEPSDLLGSGGRAQALFRSSITAHRLTTASLKGDTVMNVRYSSILDFRNCRVSLVVRLICLSFWVWAKMEQCSKEIGA